MLDARTIAHVLGGDVVGRNVVAAPGPGHSRKDRSLTIKLDPTAPDGFISHSFAGDDWRICRDYVCERLGLPRWQPSNGREQRRAARLQEFNHTTAEAERREQDSVDIENLVRTQRALAMWNQGINPTDTLAEKYLASRAIKLTHDVAGSVLRFHPAGAWRDESASTAIYLPMLLAAFTSLDNGGEVTAVQRVALNADGTKRGRRMFGIVRHAAVKLDPLGDTLAVGEGVETCLAARQLGYGPVWVLGSVGAISNFPVLDGVECLRVLGEAGTASADAIKIVGRRWHAAGRKVVIVMPDVPHSDLNDELMATNK